MRRILAFLAIVLGMAFCAWLLYPIFLPASEKVSRIQARILDRAAHHDWKKVESMVSAKYQDGAGMKKEDAIQTAKELLDPFLTLGFEWTSQTVVIEGSKATVTGTLRMHGTGPVGGSTIIDRVNKTEKPWTFVWQRDDFDRSDWKLISASNAEIESLKE
jgi:hypothetical protein